MSRCGMISFWSQMWSPLVMTATFARKRSVQILGVIPRPFAAFSPFTITKSRPRSSRQRGTASITALRPGSPTMSPRNSSFNMRADDAGTGRRGDKIFGKNRKSQAPEHLGAGKTLAFPGLPGWEDVAHDPLIYAYWRIAAGYRFS